MATALGCNLREACYGNDKVDAAAGVIHGAKLVGLESRNTGRVIGLSRAEFGDAVDQPYRYGSRALEAAIPKYEGAKIRIDHPASTFDKSGMRIVTQASRGLLETVGVVRGVRLREDGLYGDLHLLKSHPATAAVIEMAQAMPDKIALSHDARGKPVLQSGRAVIDEIYEVRSVDLVGEKPGTTNGLFESQEQEPATVKQSIKQLFEGLASAFRGRSKLVEVAADPVIGALEIEATDGANPEALVKSALEAAAAAVVTSDKLDGAAKIERSRQIIEAGAEVAGKSVDTKEASVSTSDNAMKQLIEEVALLKRERDDLNAEKAARSLLEDSGREVTDARVAALKAIPGDDARKALVETWPAREQQFAVRRPDRSPPLHESAATSYDPKETAEAFAKRMRSV